MFQYATARTLAEQLDTTLIMSGYTFSRRLEIIGHVLGLDKQRVNKDALQLGMQASALLQSAFGCGPTFVQGRLVELAEPLLRPLFCPHYFTPRCELLDESGRTFEVYDESLSGIKAGTWLEGWFQSEKYFVSNSTRIRDWFRPTQVVKTRLGEVMAEWPELPERMVAIHVRRGDYALIRDGLSDAQHGWVLPLQYYRDALKRLPADAALAIFSDDPDWAAQAFADRHPWVSRNNSAAVDMMLIAQCRYNVIANSSFSWWAAWLNAHANKIILAPKYHLGWRVGRWVPGGIEVAGWTYLEADGEMKASGLVSDASLSPHSCS